MQARSHGGGGGGGARGARAPLKFPRSVAFSRPLFLTSIDYT